MSGRMDRASGSQPASKRAEREKNTLHEAAGQGSSLLRAVRRSAALLLAAGVVWALCGLLALLGGVRIGADAENVEDAGGPGLLSRFVELLIPGAKAEVSTNLKRVEVKGKKSHRVEEAWFEDAEGKRCFAEDLGYATVRYIYNEKPRCIEESYFDLEGNRCVIREGYAMVKQTWDHNGRLLTRSYYDDSENPTLGPEGYATRRNVYDHTKQSKLVYYGTNGEYLRSDTLCAVTKYSYDKVRHLVGIECLDADLQPMNNSDGYATMVRKYRKDEMISEYFYDAEGNLAYNASRGYAGFLRTLKEKTGIPLKVEYFGSDGGLIMYKGKYASIVYENRSGNADTPNRVTYLDAEGNPVIQRGGYAAVIYEYDGRGRATSMKFLDEKLEEVVISAGYAEIRRLYTTRSKIWYESYHDLNGNPMILESRGYARVERKYGSSGNLLTEFYFDEVGDRIAVADGYSGIKNTWKSGKKTEEAYLNEAGKLTNTVNGYARVTYTYDEEGRNTAREYFDREGNSVDSEHGYARCEMSYLSDQPTAYRYYHQDGTPGEGPEGVFETRLRYQEDGEIQEMTCYGPNGKPMLSSEGWFRMENLYDGNGRKYGISYQDTNGQPVLTSHGYAAVVSGFNEHGKTVSTSYYGPDGTLMISDKGYASIRYEYDEEGQMISRTYLDASGERILLKGSSGYRQTWADGKVATRTTLGKDGEPAPTTDTYCTSVYQYGKDGRVSGISYLDAQGQPIQSSKEVFGLQYTRDKNGKITREKYLDAEGNPMVCKNGYYMRALTYNEDGNLSKEMYLEADGKKGMTAANGSGGRSIEYREDGQTERVTYLDVKGKPTEIGGKRKYSSILMIYEEDRLVARRYLNLAGETIAERQVEQAEAQPVQEPADQMERMNQDDRTEEMEQAEREQEET